MSAAALPARAAGRAPAGGLLGVLLGLAAALVLPGCGFQLRGAVDIPPELSPLYIQAGGLVGQAIEARLVGSDVGLTDSPAEAGMILNILSQDRDSRVVAVDLRGKALAYVLTYRVTFDARDAKGAELVPRQTLVLDRTFDDNPDVEVLGKELESDITYQDMASDAADQVLLRLRAALARRSAS